MVVFTRESFAQKKMNKDLAKVVSSTTSDDYPLTCVVKEEDKGLVVLTWDKQFLLLPSVSQKNRTMSIFPVCGMSLEEFHDNNKKKKHL